MCESLNGTLASVRDPYQQAYLTLLMSSLRQSAWIALYNNGVREASFRATNGQFFIEQKMQCSNLGEWGVFYFLSFHIVGGKIAAYLLRVAVNIT